MAAYVVIPLAVVVLGVIMIALVVALVPEAGATQDEPARPGSGAAAGPGLAHPPPYTRST